MESFPMSAWVSLGIKPLPAKSKCRGHEVNDWLLALQLRIPVSVTRTPSHDELQALVAGLAGLGMKAGLWDKLRIEGLPPVELEGMWREGFIVNPTLAIANAFRAAESPQRSLFVKVRGCRPRTFGNTEAELPWKTHVYQSVLAVRAETGAVDCPAKIKLIFYLVKTGHSGQDLDNLAKPVLDTLFKPSAGCKHPELAGALFACDDCILADLHLQRVWVDVPRDEGVDIEASW